MRMPRMKKFSLGTTKQKMKTERKRLTRKMKEQSEAKQKMRESKVKPSAIRKLRGYKFADLAPRSMFSPRGLVAADPYRRKLPSCMSYLL
jgi:hypothetical protein